MPAVKCGVDGCGARLQPVLKVDPRDRDTWLYPECDRCGTPACAKHCTLLEGRVLCDRCRRDLESRQAAEGIDLGLGRLTPPGGR